MADLLKRLSEPYFVHYCIQKTLDTNEAIDPSRIDLVGDLKFHPDVRAGAGAFYLLSVMKDSYDEDMLLEIERLPGIIDEAQKSLDLIINKSWIKQLWSRLLSNQRRSDSVAILQNEIAKVNDELQLCCQRSREYKRSADILIHPNDIWNNIVPDNFLVSVFHYDIGCSNLFSMYWPDREIHNSYMSYSLLVPKNDGHVSNSLNFGAIDAATVLIKHDPLILIKSFSHAFPKYAAVAQKLEIVESMRGRVIKSSAPIFVTK
jgi:hypothetical protein